ncbi:hypothetical protein RRG08_066086 [Elysia crispata]|uniref:Uncharacterized protein n=1 Tax=Elysia crispata TaxID=231223 RepID=A0AAE0YDN1_9GAST|nr:hypothetical protein RRG08_066086 [Elysia crispata]
MRGLDRPRVLQVEQFKNPRCNLGSNNGLCRACLGSKATFCFSWFNQFRLRKLVGSRPVSLLCLMVLRAFAAAGLRVRMCFSSLSLDLNQRFPRCLNEVNDDLNWWRPTTSYPGCVWLDRSKGRMGKYTGGSCIWLHAHM